MIYCPNCGSQNQPGTRFCGECGTNLENIGSSSYASQPTQQPQYSAPAYQPPQQQGYTPAYGQYQSYTEDTASWWIYLCAFCIPIVGVVLFFVWMNERPNTARTLLIISIISFVINIFSGTFYF